MFIISYLIIFNQVSKVLSNLSNITYKDQQHVFVSQARCVNSIIDTYFTAGTIIYINLYQSDNQTSLYLGEQVLKTAFSSINWKILIRSTTEIGDYWEVMPENPVGYILFTSSFQDLLLGVGWLKEYPSWRPDALFIVILSNYVDGDVNLIMNELWSSYILNIVILMDDFVDGFKIATWFPYANQNCGEYLDMYTVLDSCSNGQFLSNVSLFPDKVPKDFHGCEFKVIAVVWPPYIMYPENFDIQDNVDVPLKDGYEIYMLTTLQQYFTCQFVYRSFSQPENWGDINPNNTFTGMFDYLYQGQADIAIGAIYPIQELHLVFDTSIQYSQSQYVLVVPVADLEPPWRNFLAILPLNTYLAYCLTYIVVSGVCKVLSKNEERGTVFKTVSGSFLAVWAMALNNNVNCQPSYLRLRIVLILWAYVTLNISAFYQSGLMLSYRYPLRKYQIYKEDEIVSNGLIIGGTDAINMIYGSTDDDNSKYITDNYVDLLALDALNYVAYHKNITTIVTRDYLSFVSADLKKRVFVSPQSIMTIPIELLYSKGFPPAPKFNKMILRFLAGGLFERWKYLVGGALRKNDMEMDELDVERDGIMLEVKDVSGAFVFLIFGSCLAIVVFCIEMKMKHK